MKDARQLVMAQKWKEAAEILLKITEAEPDNAAAWFNLGLSLHYSGQVDKGIEATKKAASFEKLRAIALYNIACGYSMKKDKDEAFKYLEMSREEGFLDVAQVKRDEDLDSLRSDPRFDIYLEAVKTAIKRHPVEHHFEKLEASDGTVIKYAVILPDDYDEKEAYPVLLFAPPGAQNTGQVKWGLDYFGAAYAARRGWIVISPVAPRGKLFFRGAEQFIPELLDKLQKEYRVEDDRFFVAGCSNGGRSAFRFACLYPERFKAVVTFPGYPPTEEDFDNLDRLKGMQIRMFVGEQERPIWIKESKRTDNKLRELGIDCELHILSGEGHVLEGLAGGKLFAILDSLR